MVTEYFIPNTSSTETVEVSQTPSNGILLTKPHELVSIVRLKEGLVLNYFENFLDGGAYSDAFPGAHKPLFNF